MPLRFIYQTIPLPPRDASNVLRHLRMPQRIFVVYDLITKTDCRSRGAAPPSYLQLLTCCTDTKRHCAQQRAMYGHFVRAVTVVSYTPLHTTGTSAQSKKYPNNIIATPTSQLLPYSLSCKKTKTPTFIGVVCYRQNVLFFVSCFSFFGALAKWNESFLECSTSFDNCRNNTFTCTRHMEVDLFSQFTTSDNLH